MKVTTSGEHVESVAAAHGLIVEADDRYKYVKYAGITYRAKLGGAA